ncbi:MAG TPA: hypothetical protein VGP72_23465 [Planctomycetota bacterium]|jgi:hypothetical protein
MGDDKIQELLRQATAEPEFLEALLRDREAALNDAELEPHERAMLMAVPEEQLRKMVASARAWRMRRRAAAAGCVAVLAAGFLLPMGLRTSMGCTVELSDEEEAEERLHVIVDDERRYKEKFGRYGSLDELTRENRWLENIGGNYAYEIVASQDSFTATARHKQRPTTRKAFQVGPDGIVKETGPSEQPR